jgi:RNA polymerase sigma-32 factor
MEKRLSARDMSFDPTPESDDEEVYSPASYLPAPDADPAEQAEAEEWDATTANRLSAALKTLDARSRDILMSRWTGEAKATLHDLADKYQVSAERIRQIEANAIKKLRGALAA